ncbi:hypothetical protein FB45DRAFT_873784 [Roridomyces roridus]|uniref:Uncharacterized protein n=1 Tax=Roridomyces roridus TaxID=1738132 RepID=A0AAD7BAB1_9AGAR|nr:hypothetical protein FB45DRAFT_873784 [Roridomyces roridus]
MSGSLWKEVKYEMLAMVLCAKVADARPTPEKKALDSMNANSRDEFYLSVPNETRTTSSAMWIATSFSATAPTVMVGLRAIGGVDSSTGFAALYPDREVRCVNMGRRSLFQCKGVDIGTVLLKRKDTGDKRTRARSAEGQQ